MREGISVNPENLNPQPGKGALTRLAEHARGLGLAAQLAVGLGITTPSITAEARHHRDKAQQNPIKETRETVAEHALNESLKIQWPGLSVKKINEDLTKGPQTYYLLADGVQIGQLTGTKENGGLLLQDHIMDAIKNFITSGNNKFYYTSESAEKILRSRQIYYQYNGDDKKLTTVSGSISIDLNPQNDPSAFVVVTTAGNNLVVRAFNDRFSSGRGTSQTVTIPFQN